jgi:putative phosphoesterase
MLIGIMSDSHNHNANIRKAVEVFNKNGIARCFHEGDIINPGTWEVFKELRCPIDLVFGNLDDIKGPMIETFRGKGTFHEGQHSFDLLDRRFLMMHEPVGLDSIKDVHQYDCIIYGHTHREDIREVGGVLLVNPGEVCGYLTGVSTVVLLEVRSMKTELVTIDKTE